MSQDQEYNVLSHILSELDDIKHVFQSNKNMDSQSLSKLSQLSKSLSLSPCGLKFAQNERRRVAASCTDRNKCLFRLGTDPAETKAQLLTLFQKVRSTTDGFELALINTPDLFSKYHWKVLDMLEGGGHDTIRIRQDEYVVKNWNADGDSFELEPTQNVAVNNRLAFKEDRRIHTFEGIGYALPRSYGAINDDIEYWKLQCETFDMECIFRELHEMELPLTNALLLHPSIGEDPRFFELMAKRRAFSKFTEIVTSFDSKLFDMIDDLYMGRSWDAVLHFKVFALMEYDQTFGTGLDSVYNDIVRTEESHVYLSLFRQYEFFKHILHLEVALDIADPEPYIDLIRDCLHTKTLLLLQICDNYVPHFFVTLRKFFKEECAVAGLSLKELFIRIPIHQSLPNAQTRNIMEDLGITMRPYLQLQTMFG